MDKGHKHFTDPEGYSYGLGKTVQPETCNGGEHLMIDMNMYQHCIPSDIAKETIAQIIRVESGNNPIAINVNGNKVHFKKPATMEEVQTGEGS